MSHYKPYPAYKDSGVDWIGKVPEHWGVKPIKVITSCNDDSLPESIPPDMPIRYVDISAVSHDGGISGAEPMIFGEAPSRARRMAKLGDVVVSTVRTYLKAVASVDEAHSDCVYSTGFAVLRARSEQLAPAFLKWLALNDLLIQAVESHSEGLSYPAINSSELVNLKTVVPGLPEQKRIAAILDRETTRIDVLISKKTEFIELLTKKRQALITQAVTKGLNPIVKMKDSGVEWIGEVPEHWVVISIGYVLDAVGDVDHFMPVSVVKGVPYLMTGDLKELASRVNLEDCKQVSHNDYAKLSKRIKSSKGDVIVARYATIGTSMYVDIDIDFLVSYSCVTIKTTPSRVSGLYLFQYLKSDAFYQGINNQINTSTQGNVGINDLKKVKMALPSLAEQSRIIEYLNSKLKNIDSLTEKTQLSIDLLKKRRSTLITAAVTGQIDLRESA